MLKVKRKIATLRAARVLQQGGLLAHQTATVAGVAAHPDLSMATKKIQRFKQRHGPFLLLADSLTSALHEARFITPQLRQLARNSWPGPVTLVLAGKPKRAKLCYQHGMIAIRVDADVESRRLASLCGGMLLSSSLNRQGQAILPLNHKMRMRFSSSLSGCLLPMGMPASGIASRIYRCSGLQFKRLR